ncbi:DUF3667 domain-containing protein [Flavobacterium jejuense]|uniref:DUF3667 domain-containing protein n=1 Tax=Flavobacterium jejuense TaxID=1544455 RepID=A0ABX0IRE4_9FLAO|nr:DUF3667 domain-containing protein [Flavobacterium jejuense]NHN26414.1 DUF3667 domain-containing protein [Flavobacterium jejuense]
MIKRKFKQYRGIECLNCETPIDISEKYCHHCGQLNSTKKITISDFIEEFLSNFYAYDSRLRNSIISMVTKPGVLAKEFNAGKRQKYANPFRLFLSISIILFLTFSLSEKNSSNTQEINSTNFINSDKLNKGLEQINDSIPNVNKLDIKDQINAFRNLNKDSIYTKSQLKKSKIGFYYEFSSFRNFNKKHPNKTAGEALKELEYENTQFNRFLFNKSILFKTNDIKNELTEYFYQKLPFLIFLSLPIITIIFWLVFYSKKLNYTEHLVFTYTYFTFLFLCMILFNIIGEISENLFETTTFIYFVFILPIYFYKSLRNFYEQNRWKTILKFILLNPLFGIFLFISMLVMIFLGIILF